MQENEFEKQVKQSMEELKLNPSDEVWQNVAIAISKKKRNKSFFWILSSLFFLLIAGILGWNYFMNGQVKDTAAVKHIDLSNQLNINAAYIPPAKPIIANVKDSALQNRRVVDIDKLNNSKGLLSIPYSKSLLIGNTKGVGKSQRYSTTAKRNVVEKPNYLTHKAKGINKGKKYIEISNVAIDSLEDEVNRKGLPAIPVIELTGNFYQKPLLPEASISTKVFSNVPKINSQLITVSAAEKGNSQRTAHKNKKIIWGISFALGRGATGEKYLSKIANRSYYDYAQSQNNSTGSGSAYSNFKPSLVQPGLSFQIGVNASKEISRRSYIGVGLQYLQISTRIKTILPVLNAQGVRMQENGSNNNYINRNQFLQLTADFSTQLTNFKKHNLFFNTGISVSQLIQTNSPQFNNVTGQYFIDNTFFNKTITGFSAGIDINISKNVTAPLLLGPSFYYSLTPIGGKGLYVKSRYSFLGVRLLKKFGRT